MVDQSEELNKSKAEAKLLRDELKEILFASRDIAQEAGLLAKNLGLGTIEAAAFRKAFKETANIAGELANNADKILAGQAKSKNLQKDIEKNTRSRKNLEQEISQILMKENLFSQKEITKAMSKQDGLLNLVADSQKDISNEILEAVSLADEQVANNLSNNKTLDAQLKKQKEIEKTTGLTGKLLKGINKIPLVGQFVDSAEALEKMQAAAAGGAGKVETMFIGLKSAGKDIAAGLTDPLFIMTQLVKAGLEFDSQLTKIEKNLGTSRDSAAFIRLNFTALAGSSNKLAITSAEVMKAFTDLNEQFGTASTVLRDDIIVESAELMKLTGQSAESVANFAKFANISGKNMAVVTKEARAAVVAAEKENGVRLDINKVLEETGKITGQIAAQLGGNPEKIAKAVSVAKQFGMTLEGVAAAGKSLLNFEESINSELEAELLTGKKLNLERARLAALTGDYETLTKEINENVGDFSDFTKMNVLQQEALAKSVGMTADALADQLLTKANLEQLAQEARAGGDEDLAKQLEARSAQEDFNDAVAKLKGLFTDIVGGPLSAVLDLLTMALTPITLAANGLTGIMSLFKDGNKELTFMESLLGSVAAAFLAIKGTMMTIKAIQIATNVVKAIGLGFDIATGKTSAKNILSLNKGLGKNIALAAAKIFGTFAKIPFGLGIPLAIASVIGMAALVKKMSKADDGIFEGGGYGKRALLDEGSITLFNNKDTIIAGTNLNKGDDVISKPKGSVDITPSFDYEQMAQAFSNVNISATTKFDDFGSRSNLARTGLKNNNLKNQSSFA